MKVEIYSDVVCPWCYIGKERFERALASFPGADQVEVVFRPFQLDPGAPAAAAPLTDALTRRYGPRAASMMSHAAEAARGEGIVMDFANALAVNTFDAHRLLRLAEQDYGAEVQRILSEHLFEAHFARGADVSNTTVLVELGVAAGMDAAQVEEYLASDEGSEELRSEIADAQRLGVTAVPTFVFEGRYGVQGAQDASAFLRVLEAVARETTPPASNPGPAEACADGFCAA